MICLLVAGSRASVKTDPVTGSTSNGVESAVIATSPVELGFGNCAAIQQELETLYQEAFVRKLAEQDDSEIWARISELNLLLSGRNESTSLDEGGETCDNAVVISSLPYCDTGNTSDNENNFQPNPDDRCGPNPPGEDIQGDGNDVVYAYTPQQTEVVSISLCGSLYDTYLYIYQGGCPGDSSAVLVCCSDDHGGACPNGSGNLTSCCNELALTAGETYYIIVDGWRGSSNGDYRLHMNYGIRCEQCPPEPCVDCPADAYQSIEPVCENGYVDQTNAGCLPGAAPLYETANCNSVICGTGGTYAGPNGDGRNDEDWYLLELDQQDSLIICVLADAPGTWGIWRILGNEICGDVLLLDIDNFDHCDSVYYRGCVPAGRYWVGIVLAENTPCGTNYLIDIQCLPCIPRIGRCCYDSDHSPACADELTREECAELEGLWTEGATCEECCPTDFCDTWIEIPGVHSYIHTENSCCSIPVDFCVGENGCDEGDCYPANRAVIYRMVLEADAIMTLVAAGPGDNQLMVFTDCNDPEGSCVASSDNGLPFVGGAEQLVNLSLPAGSYFVSTSHYFWNSFPCGEITLRIISDTPLPVELIGFDAIALDGAIKLSWQTASESNSSHFDVLRDGTLVNRVTATNSATGSSYTWTDNSVENGRAYHYSLVAVDLNGTQSVVGEVNAMPTAEAATIREFALHQNFPNPFNPETMITFDLPQSSEVRLAVINALGQEVVVLASGLLDAGRHNMSFDGSALPSGLYFYHLTAGDFTQMRKMILLK